MSLSTSRGYLREPYRLFHISDRRDADFESHFHDFHKVVFCLKGHVDYVIEGVCYRLAPWDVLIVPMHQIHHSTLTSSELYERFILWIGPAFFEKYSFPALQRPFLEAGAGESFLFHLSEPIRSELYEKLKETEKAAQADFEGHELLADTFLLQFLLYLQKLKNQGNAAENTVITDPLTMRVLQYLNTHLCENLEISRVAADFYVSPSHLMHNFKKRTGCTVHQYITQKRLILAVDLIHNGEPVVAVVQSSGFKDYSAFLKAFRCQYGCTPTEMKKASRSL